MKEKRGSTELFVGENILGKLFTKRSRGQRSALNVTVGKRGNFGKRVGSNFSMVAFQKAKTVTCLRPSVGMGLPNWGINNIGN